ncbi:hypothetical protein K440DRAFT_55680 [Wilcoxina mikolae CBS 423.85]|nr:hypothetical protein K440DRAFT_55680 [Wilcoxina mikolae CBS 423.85]
MDSKDHPPQSANATSVPLPAPSSAEGVTNVPNESETKAQPSAAPHSAPNPPARTSSIQPSATNAASVEEFSPITTNPPPSASTGGTDVPSAAPQKGSTLAVPARSSSTKMTDPSPTSTASTAGAAMSDNASTGSKRKRRRGEGESSSVKSGGRTRKPGGIGPSSTREPTTSTRRTHANDATR